MGLGARKASRVCAGEVGFKALSPGCQERPAAIMQTPMRRAGRTAGLTPPRPGIQDHGVGLGSGPVPAPIAAVERAAGIAGPFEHAGFRLGLGLFGPFPRSADPFVLQALKFRLFDSVVAHIVVHRLAPLTVSVHGFVNHKRVVSKGRGESCDPRHKR